MLKVHISEDNKLFIVPPLLSGFVCAYHTVVPGLNPKQTINAEQSNFVLYLSLYWEKGRE